MEFRKVTDKANLVTDPVMLSVLAGQGIDKDGVAFVRDYAPRSRSKGCSAYAKHYRDLNSDKLFSVFSGLPMLDAFGQSHELVWQARNGSIENGNNLFHAVIDGLDTRLVTLSGQPGGLKRDAEIRFHPRLFIGGSEVKPLSPQPRLLETDPVNENYHNNVLEWDYGVCLRRIRLIEGRFLGAWVFLTHPRAAVRIKYHQSGDFSLRLGRFAVTRDEEFIPAACFDNPAFGYPVTVSDSATFYPDADPESLTVDGGVWHTQANSTWASLIAAAGNNAADSNTFQSFAYYRSYTGSGKYEILLRSIFLFNVSIAGTVTGAVFSVYGDEKYDGNNASPDVNLYSSNPTGNNALAAGDFDSLGSTPFCVSPVTYSGWNISGYNNFTLNAAGLSAIPSSGIAKLGLRNANYDVANSTPPWVSGQSSYVKGYCAEQGAGYKPKLVVTYTGGESKSSGDSGGGVDVIVIRSLDISETGSGAEASAAGASIVAGDSGSGGESLELEAAGPTEAVAANDAGIGADAFKTLVQQAGTDLKLNGNSGRLELPHKEVHL